jgi:hypothetical protein
MGPSLTFSDRVRAMCGAVTARDIAAGAVPWLTPELLATPLAWERLSEWIRDGGLTRPEPDVARALHYFGDAEMLDHVVSVAETIAPPVRDFVLANLSIVGSGWSTLGWIAPAPARRPVLVVLCGRGRDAVLLRRTIAHEFAHGWLESYGDGSCELRPTAHVIELQREVAATNSEWSEQERTFRRRVEFRADQLADKWCPRGSRL